MTFKLIERCIGDVAEIIGGGTPSSKVDEYYRGDIPWITPKDLSGYSDVYISQGSRNITELGLAKSSAKMLPKNAVLFTSRAPIGYVALAETSVCTNQGFKSLIPKEDVLNYRFAYYLMKYYAPQIESSASGTTFKEISGGALKSFKVKIPESIDTQKGIADILFKIDSKISNNNAMNATLEKIAQRIFKSWFVDFEPVKANAEGVPFDGLSPEIQALFPNELEESELGMIPKGWSISSLENINPAMNGFAFKSSDWGDCGDRILKIGGVKGSVVDEERLGFVKSEVATEKNKFKLSLGDLVIGMTGYVGETSLIPDSKESIYLNQRVGVFREKYGSYIHTFTWALSKTGVIKSHCETYAKGSAQLNVSIKEIGQMKVIVPSSELLSSFANTISPIINKVVGNDANSKTLEKIRNALLPRLISGKITIEKAEEMLDMAV